MSDITEALGHFADDEPSGETIPVEGVALMAALMQKSSDDLQWTNNQLIDGYKRDADELRATLAAVRSGIIDLLEGPWMPTSSALIAALYPYDDQVDRFR